MNISKSFEQWRRTRRTLNELRRLSERELEDIGFSRGDIDEVAKNATKR